MRRQQTDLGKLFYRGLFFDIKAADGFNFIIKKFQSKGVIRTHRKEVNN